MSSSSATPTRDAIYAGNWISSSSAAAVRSSTSASSTTEANSVAQVLDSYIVHMIMTLLMIIGGIILLTRYADSASNGGKDPYSGWNELVFAFGGIALILNAGFVVSYFIAWMVNKRAPRNREGDEDHVVHALSIIASVSGAIWGIIALFSTFGDVLASTSPNNAEAVGYFMVMFAVVYDIYMAVRWISGLAGSGKKPPKQDVQPPATTLDDQGYLASFRRTGGQLNTPAAAPALFGNSSGAAAFGGLDLGAFPSSSVSAAPAPPQPQQPMMMPPLAPPWGGGMMMYPGYPQQPMMWPGGYPAACGMQPSGGQVPVSPDASGIITL